MTANDPLRSFAEWESWGEGIGSIMSDLSGLLDKIKERPQMYLSGRSINYLRAYLDGYLHAAPNEERDAIGGELGAFRDWLAGKYGITSNQSWNQIVLFYSTDETTALDGFFGLYEEFRNSDQ